jgi:hypothetical protein
MADETATPKPMKPGWKTSEFWLSTATMLLGQAYAAGMIGESGTAAKIAALACSMLAALGYTVSRGMAKALKA